MAVKPPESNDPTASEVSRQKAEILRGTQDVITEAELDARLAQSITEGRPLRVKLGVDPTAEDLHLGFAVGLNKLRIFQDLGHQAVLIIGDGTAMVGDPTGRNQARPQLTLAEVERNAASYLDQAGKILDMDRLEVRRNSEWLFDLGFHGMVDLASRYTVARLLERDDFSKRFKGGQPIHVHEFLYPLLQGWDSVAVRADVELGGSDQLFNLLVGRDLQDQEGQARQICLTTPLLIGLDGRQKMSKSFGNWIGISEVPEEMFLKLMRIDDSLIEDYFILGTRLSMPEVKRIVGAGTHPRELKDLLGRTIVAMYHGEAAAEAAADHFRRTVSNRELPDDLATWTPPTELISDDGGIVLADLVRAAFGLKSRSEARRLISQGGVALDEERMEDPFREVTVRGGEVLRAGRRRVVRLAAPGSP